MEILTPAPSPATKLNTKRPTPEMHLKSAAEHAEAERAHRMAAKELKKGNTATAKLLAKVAAGHGVEATSHTNELLSIYDIPAA